LTAFPIQLSDANIRAASAANLKRPVPFCDRVVCVWCLQVVLLQELDRWNALITRMQASLKDLQKALAGEIGMSG
jgi:hypothetical protein